MVEMEVKRSKIDVNRVIKKSGIAREAYKAFLEFYRKEEPLSGDAPVDHIKFSSCKFELVEIFG
jgi:hypothetical protein